MRWLIIVALATLPLLGCYSSSPSPVVVLPQGASVMCANGSPAAYVNGAYRCY